MKGRNFEAKSTHDLRESYSLLQERTQYFTHGDRCFGHLPVVGCLQDKVVMPDPPESG